MAAYRVAVWASEDETGMHVLDGTAQITELDDGTRLVDDFRDLDGAPIERDGVTFHLHVHDLGYR